MKLASNGITIHVQVQGTGALSLVFLHDYGGSSRRWRHVTAFLARAFRTVAIDQRGWGQSAAPATGYALADLAADAQGVIASLQLQRYVLVGHAMGGKVAQLIAARQPAGLVGLILLAPAPPSPMVMPAPVRAQMAAAQASRAAVEADIEHTLTARPLCAEDREQVIEDSLRGAPAAKAAWPQVSSLEDISAAVAEINVPVLVIAGALDRVAPPIRLQAALLPRLPQATLQILPGTGHLSMLEAPACVAALITSFCAPLASPGGPRRRRR